MPVDIRCVVCERAQGKCIPVDIVGILQHGNYEISAADVVQQVTEVFIAERIIAEVLDDAPAIRVGVRVIELIFRWLRKSLFQKRLDLVCPCEINDLFVREHGAPAHPLRKCKDEEQSHSNSFLQRIADNRHISYYEAATI